jgi:hypothetical protein
VIITIFAQLPVSMQLACKLQLPCAVETRAASQRRVSCLAARHMPSLAQRLNHDARMTAGEAGPAAVQLASTAGESAFPAGLLSAFAAGAFGSSRDLQQLHLHKVYFQWTACMCICSVVFVCTLSMQTAVSQLIYLHSQSIQPRDTQRTAINLRSSLYMPGPQ